MKKFLLLVAVLILIMVTTSCQKPEEVTLSKYFSAIKTKDRNTMASIAAEPVALEYKSWKLVSAEAPTSEDIILPQLIKTLADLKAKKDKQILLVKDKKDFLDELKTKLGETRGSRQKAELQKQIDVTEQEVAAETLQYKQDQVDNTQMKNQVEFEKKLVSMSTSIEQNQELFNGKALTVKAIANIVTASGDKEYVFLLRKYELINPVSNKVFPSRYVILKIQPKEDFEQGK